MLYRRIVTENNCEVLQPLSESESRLFYRERENKKRKKDREQTVSAYISGIMFVLFVIAMIVKYIVFGY